MAFDWDEQIKQQIDNFNRKLMTTNPTLGYVHGGMPRPAGLIPGPVNPNTGDDAMTPVKRGEYIIPLDAVLAIGKRVLDEKVMGLKQEMGNNTPPRNMDTAGIPQKGFAAGGMPVGSDYPVAGANFPQAGADFPKAGVDPATGKPWPVAGSDFPQAGLQPSPQPRPQTGYADGGMPISPDQEKFPLTEAFDKVQPAGIPAGPAPTPKAAELPLPNTPVTPAPVPPAVQTPATAGIPNPNAVLLKVGAGETGTGYEPAVTVTNGNVDRLAGLNAARGVVADRPNNLPDLANSVKDLKATSSGTDIVNDKGISPMVTMRGIMDPAAAGKLSDRVDWSADSKNVQDAAVNAKYKDDVAKAVRVNAANGIAPDAAQIKTLGMNSSDVANLLAANDKDGRFDKAIAAGLETAKNVNTAALQQSEITRNKAIGDWHTAQAGGIQTGLKPLGTTEAGMPVFTNNKGQVLTNGPDGVLVPYMGKVVGKAGSGAPSAYKDFRASEEAKLDAEGVTNPGERSQRISEAYKKSQIELSKAKGLGMADSKGMQAYNLKTDKVEMVSWADHKNNPNQYVGTQDANYRAFKTNVEYYRANANFVNSIDAFGKLATDIMQKYDLNNNPKFANYTIQQLMGMKRLGSGDVAALNGVLVGLRGEMAKMAEGSLGVAGASVESAKRYQDIVNPSMPVKDLQTVMDWAGKEGRVRLSAIDMETNRLKKEMGYEAPPVGIPAPKLGGGTSQPAGLLPDGQGGISPQIQESGRLMAKDMHSSNWGNEAFQKQVYDHFKSLGYSHDQINQIGEIAARLK